MSDVHTPEDELSDREWVVQAMTPEEKEMSPIGALFRLVLVLALLFGWMPIATKVLT